MNDISGIYCIENIINNKKYIGQSKHINERWLKHISELNHGYHHNDYLQKSWNKYGKDNINIIDTYNWKKFKIWRTIYKKYIVRRVKRKNE